MDFKTQELAAVNQGKDRGNWRLIAFGRRFFVIFLLLVQLVFFVYISWSGSRVSEILHWGFRAVSILLSLFIIQKNASAGYKLLWVFFFLALPIFGVCFYFLVRRQLSTGKMRRVYAEVEAQAQAAYASLDVQADDSGLGSCGRLSRYLKGHGFSMSCGDKTDYYPSGEEAFAVLIRDLESAEKYIFLEYFIIGEGALWTRIYDILRRKVQEGVEVRVMMDDMGCFVLGPRYFKDEMQREGLKIQVFGRFIPWFSAIQNNRDHRKIAIIDGKIAHTGGLNIADEYVNVRERFGYWKDTAVRMEGPVVRQWLVMFLSMWDCSACILEDWEQYLLPDEAFAPAPEGEDACFVWPYADSPLVAEPLIRNVYLFMIQNAKESLYICTPYLLPDDSLVDSLLLAAASGVDVRIVVPFHADKKIVKATARTYFKQLIEGGVKVYEYTPGFNHGKMLLADGKLASCGTANFEYRSLFLHYECGALMQGGPVARKMEKDFEDIFAQSARVELQAKSFGYFRTVWQQFLRLLAPLM